MALFDGHPQRATSLVASAPSPATSGTTLTVATGEGSRFPIASMPFNATVGPDATEWTPANTEDVRVTGRSGDVLTIVRAQEGSSARTVVVGDRIRATASAKTFTDLELAAANASPAFPSMQFYGHSWMFGTGGPGSKYGMPQRTARELGVAFDGQSLSGGMVTGLAANGGVGAMSQNPDFATDLVRGPYVTPGGLKAVMIGYNDYPSFNALTNGDLQVENALTLAFSRILAARVIPPLMMGAGGSGVALNTVDVTYNGTWTGFADTAVSEGPGSSSGFARTATVNDSVDYALDADYNGEAITAICPLVSNTGRWTAEIRLDPAGANTLLATQNFTQFQANLATAGITSAMHCIRVPAGTISAGAHTIRVKATAITGSNFAVNGGLIVEGTAPLLVPLFPPQPSTPGVVAQRTWDNARNTNAAANFPTATLVDLSSWVSPNYGTGSEAADVQYWSSTALGHLNERGYAKAAQALIEASKDITLPKLSEMTSPQASARGLARWMKPNQGWVLSTNRGISENFGREDAAATLTLLTGKVYGLGGFTIPAGRMVTGVNLQGTNAGLGWTAKWVGLARLSDRVVIAVSQNSTAAIVIGESPQWFTKPYIATDDVDVYALFGGVFTTGPILASKASNATTAQRAPVLHGISTTAATATPPTAEVLASSGLTAVAGTALGVFSTSIASVPHVTLLG